MKKLLLMTSLMAAGLQMSAQEITLNPMTVFQGMESGLYVSPLWNNINISPDVNLRGVSTLRAGGGPVWVVDGIVLNDTHLSDLNPLSYLNPYDIESVEIVKNISRAAAYGNKTAGGVVIINTAMPQDRDFGVTYNGNAGVTLPVAGLQSSRTGCVTNHSLAFSGRQGKTVYGASGYYNFSQGSMKQNDFSSGGLHAKFDTKANDILWFGSNTSCAVGNMTSAVPGAYLEGWSEDFGDEAADKRLTNSTYITLNLKDNFKFNVDLGIDFHNVNRYIWYGEGTEVGKEENGSAFVTGTSQLRYNIGADLSWYRYFNSLHKVSARGAFELDGGNTNYNCTGGSDFFSHYLKARGIGLAASDPFINKYKYSYFSLGGVVEFSYDYNSKTGVDVLARIDNTPRYDGGKVRLYKSMNLYWDIKKTLFPQSDVVSSFRINAGYGDAGKESPAPYAMYPLYLSGDYKKVDADIQMFYSGLNRLKSSEFNASVDAGFLSDRLLVEFGYYDRMTSDTFISYCFGESDGHYWGYTDGNEEYRASSIIANRGFEADVKAQVFDNKKFGWSLRANASYNLNQLLKVDALDAGVRKADDDLTTSLNILGNNVGSFYGYKTDTDGKYCDMTGEGEINEYDKVLIGSPVPEFYGGFGSSFRIDDFSLDFQCSWASGFEMLDLTSLYANEISPYVISDKYVSSGDYFSLSKITASYRFQFDQKKFIKGITVRFAGMNLLMTNKMYKTPKNIMFGVSIHI